VTTHAAEPTTPLLMAVPNVSEGRDPSVVGRIGVAYVNAGATLLATHEDPDHHRAVHTLAAPQGQLAAALAAGAREAADAIDLQTGRGLHPHVGALDVCPVVFLDEPRAGAAIAEALLTAQLIGEAGLPVLLYGELAGGRTRASLRRGGTAELIRRVEAGELKPDFGPRAIHPSTGAVLVAARPPLIAFNLELAPPATLDDARAIAARIREGGEAGLPGVRAIGLQLSARGGIAQVSCNVEDHRRVPLVELVAAVAQHAAVARCELVGLAPRSAFAGFPDGLEVDGLAYTEDALAAAGLPNTIGAA
jgi:glutamate formiminotransferase/glutamate formiminotransferase/formiminotetrahydrofolate cyclodeaminase